MMNTISPSRRHHSASSLHIRRQSGVTLIELMVALLLGGILTAAIFNLVITNNRTATMTESVNQAQETGRFVISYLNRSLMRAGYDPRRSRLLPWPFKPVCTLATCNDDDTIDRTDGSGDQIAMTRVLDDGLSCAGTNLTSLMNTEVVDVFWVDQTDTTLMCATFDRLTGIRLSNNQPIAEGVEAMHVLYGISTDANSRQVDRFVTADKVDIDNNTISENRDWQRVIAVRIALLTVSMTQQNGGSLTSEFILLDSEKYQFTDGFSRQLFTTTVALSNF